MYQKRSVFLTYNPTVAIKLNIPRMERCAFMFLSILSLNIRLEDEKQTSISNRLETDICWDFDL